MLHVAWVLGQIPEPFHYNLGLQRCTIRGILTYSIDSLRFRLEIISGCHEIVIICADVVIANVYDTCSCGDIALCLGLVRRWPHTLII